jgi:RNHCP domain
LPRDQRSRRGPGTFRCRHCRLEVSSVAPGTRHRNHCPTCLWSRHVDDHLPGDRAAPCAGSMEPIAVTVRDDGEWALVHRCGGCATLRMNRIAGDDNPHTLMQLASRPLERPPWAG